MGTWIAVLLVSLIVGGAGAGYILTVLHRKKDDGADEPETRS